MGGRKWTASIIREDRILSRENYGKRRQYSPILNHVRGYGKCDSITNPEEVNFSETKTFSASMFPLSEWPASGVPSCIFNPALDYLAE
jgi:hypothetical protein